MALQAKLLRVIQDGRFERLGSSKTISTNVRLIAASNQDLDLLVKEGKFRQDLFYRLNVFPISVPPLRDRREDIPLLAWHFIKEFNQSIGKRINSLSKRAMEILTTYSWPGNVRELRNVIERAVIVSKGAVLEVGRITSEADDDSRSMTLAAAEHRHILEVLNLTGWRISGKNSAAEILGLRPSTLYSRMKKLGIRRPD
jgi:transcriptional regulator with GAF, ATPase, and Fis domain